jgi:ribosomal protein L2
MSKRFVKNLFIDKFGSLNHLSKKIKKSCGRSFGKIVSRNRFTGSKKKIRILDYYRSL